MKRKTLKTTLLSFVIIPLLASCGQNEHNFSSKWESDEDYHWHVCLTEGHTDVSDKEKHVWDAGKVTKEPSKTETGIMKYACSTCLREKTEIIDKLKEESTYTITFDSKGGSEVASISAPAGAKIEAPASPTKEGFLFADWYESNDGGATLAEKPFEFTYMPARFFTLYAKWGFDSIKGKTFKHTSSVLTWSGTEEEKKAFLGEMGLTEEQYKKMNEAAIINFTFDKVEEKASASFGVEMEGETSLDNCTVLYKLTGNTIVFYDSEEDLKVGLPAHKYGLFAGVTFSLSPDRSQMILTGVMGILKLEHILSVVKE